MRKLLVVSILVLLATLSCAARELVVTSTADTGQGTLRWALETARSGDVINFDSLVFPPENPATIFLRGELPVLSEGRITIDASNAGAIIDGSGIPSHWCTGITVSSNHNVIMGLQIVNFSGSGIALCTADFNTIGGSRDEGRGPVGEGNLISANWVGIDLCDQGVGNTITGNLIGTREDGITPWANFGQGVWIEDGITETTIGPHNVICSVRDSSADSRDSGDSVLGILVSGHRSGGNTITRNVHLGDPFAAIQLLGGGNTQASAPNIVVSDPATGSVSGLATPNASVEIYSSSEVSRKITYEGTAYADERGDFSFSLSQRFSGDVVSCISTSPDGNSSPFSLTLSTDDRVTSLQLDNHETRAFIQSTPSPIRGDNHIGGGYGGWVWDPASDNSGFYDSLLEDIEDLGISWFHTSFESQNPLCWQWVLRSPGRYVIPEDVDNFVTSLASAGVNVIISLGTGMGLDGNEYGWDCWGDPGWGALGNREPHERFRTQEEIDQYLEYVAFMVNHFKGRVQHYEIWNEPNVQWSPDVCLGTIEAETYARLVRETAPLIHSLDSDAVAIAGASALFGPQERAWQLTWLDDGVAELIDGISWHPFFGPGPGSCVGKCPEPGYWETYPESVRDFMSRAEALGFTGEYYVDEMVWRSGLDYVPSEPPIYTEIQAAKLAARANVLHLALGFEEASNQLKMPAGILRVPRYYALRNLCTAMAGHKAIDMPVEVDVEHDGPVVYCAFSYPNGDRMLAIWTDGVVQDDDHGVLATIRFAGLEAGSVAGIDVLHGFEHELAFDVTAGSTEVLDLLVKDYPILIRLSGVKFGPNYEEAEGDGLHQLGSAADDRDGDGVPDSEDLCPEWPGSEEMSGC